jgi:ribosomal protein L32
VHPPQLRRQNAGPVDEVAAGLLRRRMRRVADSPVNDAELTECPSCGRATRTVGAGACAECWHAKVPGGRGVLGEPRPRTEPFLGFSLDVFDVVPWWVWAGATAGLIIAPLLGLIVSALIA